MPIGTRHGRTGDEFPQGSFGSLVHWPADSSACGQMSKNAVSLLALEMLAYNGHRFCGVHVLSQNRLQLDDRFRKI